MKGGKKVSPIKLKYDDKSEINYCIYLDGKRYKKNTDITAGKHTVILEEDNAVLSRYWWIVSFFIIIFSFLGSYGEDWKDVRRFRKRIEFEFEDYKGNMTVYIRRNGDIDKIDGVGSYNIISDAEINVSVEVNKRIKIYKTIMLTVCFGILATLLILLVWVTIKYPH
jgi:hypothetical protein